MQRLLHFVLSLLVVWLVLVDLSGFSLASNPYVELPSELQRSHHLFDLNPGAEYDAAPVREGEAVEIRNSGREEDSALPFEVVTALDELTRCIRGSEAGDAIERWLDCLALQEGGEKEEEVPAAATSMALKPSQNLDMEPSQTTTDLDSSGLEVDSALLDETDALNPWSVGSGRSQNSERADENSDGVEGLGLAPSSTQRSQNLLDGLTLAACLGAAVTLIWRKRGRLRPFEKAKQSVLSEGAMDYPCPSATGFSMTARSSSSTDACYPNVKAGSLSTPLGMAIATVMAETLMRGYDERAPRTADELSKLLEAAMTESLSPVMGNECPGFVEQFKQSFRSTYRLLGSVRIASDRNLAPPPFANRSGGFSQRRSEGPSRRYYRRADDEADGSSGLTSSSRVAYLDSVFESDSLLQRRLDPDSESDLAEQLSRLTFSSNRPGTATHSRLGGTPPLPRATGGTSDNENSSHVDQEAIGEFDDVSSPLRSHSEALSEKSSGNGGSWDLQNGVRSKWGRGGLEQLANFSVTEGERSPSASEQVGRKQEGNSFGDGDLDHALEPFGVIPPGQLVATSESHFGGGTHYKQQKMVLMEKEMHLRKLELAYKFRDLNLKEASLHLSSESNSLMRENVDLSRNRAEFKEAEFQDRKLTAAYTELTKRCADEMVAGLCVMLCSLFFGAWNYSYERLVDVVSVCQPTLYEPSNSYVPGFNAIVNSLNHMVSQFHMFACEVTVASRMFLGLGTITVVAAALLRKSVTSNSQAMPATILVVVLGGICGCAGKFAVDSMGGSGYHWLLLWETFCLVHTAATCCPSALHRILNGVPPSATGKSHRPPHVMRPWWRRFWFHVTTVLVLPILAGLLPFARVREIGELLAASLWNLAFPPVESFLRKNYYSLRPGVTVHDSSSYRINTGLGEHNEL